MRNMLLLLIFLGTLTGTILLHLGAATDRENKSLWHYQLQSYDCNAVRKWEFDYVVVDLDEYNCATSGTFGKILAYISIGEAEDYRNYWEELPKDLVLFENPEWKGNYAVKFWDPRWKEIVLGRVVEAKSKGFNGVYLDKADVYEEIDHKEDMIGFICEIAETAHEMNLLVFVQNAVELYLDIRDCIDGIGKEDTWYFDNVEISGEGLEYLRRALTDGKVILVIDYPTEVGKVCSFYSMCFSEGFYCTVSNRELNLSFPITCPSS